MKKSVRAIAMLIAAVLFMSACAQAKPASPSYQYGYDLMINNSRQIIVEVNGQLRSEGKAPNDSPAQLFGQHGENIASACEGNLEAIIGGTMLGTRPQLPVDFSSGDFLKGCNDGGKALLASGQ